MRLSEDDQLRADLIQQLMCQGEVSIDAIERRYGDRLRRPISPMRWRNCSHWQDDGLVRFEPGPDRGHQRKAGCCCVISPCASTVTCDPATCTPRGHAGARFSRAI